MLSSILTLLLIPVVFAQTLSSWDLLNLFEQFKATDPNIIKAYQLTKMPEMWAEIESKELNLSPVVVGIPDTGVDSLHPEFSGTVLFSDSLDLAGVSSPLARFTHGHGTQVAGIIGANNTSFGGAYTSPEMNGLLSGVQNFNYKLVGKRVLNLTWLQRFLLSVDKVDSLAKLSDLMNSKPNMVNISFGGDYKDPDLFENNKKVYEKFFNNHPDTLFVTGAGNDGVDTSGFLPAALSYLPNVLTVGATGLNDGRAIFDGGSSNFGVALNLSAPGTKVYAPAPRGRGNFPQDGGDYEKDFNGTSASAPLVTGVAAILKALEPEYKKYMSTEMSPAKIKEILIKSADVLTTDDPDELTKKLGPTDGPINCNYHNVSNARGCRLNAHRAVVWQLPPTPVQIESITVVPAP